ncbi:MAG: MinD/ParA family protein [Clostridiaceae bacterium]|jgi:flagellar biosynthesis protein FlhG|nr:MinD/ParA family protein [Clostridiaceae bacterium]
MTDQAEKLRQVIDNLKLKQAVNRVLAPAAPVKRNARVITVTSGKGGVGKTNITINLAIALSEQGQRVIILDADFGLANIDVLFGIVPQYTLLDVIKNKKNILEVLTEGPRNTKFISGGSGVEDLVKLDRQQIARFVENMSLLDKLADIIIVDTGAGLSENVMSFVAAADEVLLVTTPEPTSITDAYALIKMVSNRDRTKTIRVIVNRSESSSEANDVLNKLVLVADRFLGIKLEPAGYILHDESVVKAVKQQQPFSIVYPKSQAARNIREISDKLIQRGDSNQQNRNNGVRGFLSRLVGFMKV